MQLADGLFAILWTVLRVGGVVMLAPLLGAMYVPRRIRLAMALVLSLALLPLGGTAAGPATH